MGPDPKLIFRSQYDSLPESACAKTPRRHQNMDKKRTRPDWFLSGFEI